VINIEVGSLVFGSTVCMLDSSMPPRIFENLLVARWGLLACLLSVLKIPCVCGPFGANSCQEALANSNVLAEFVGASTPEVRELHKQGCLQYPDATYSLMNIPWRTSILHPEPAEEVGVCLPNVCLALAEDQAKVGEWVLGLLAHRCRDGHPRSSMHYSWPGPGEWGVAGFNQWYERVIGSFEFDTRIYKYLAFGAFAECPAATCSVLGAMIANWGDGQWQRLDLMEELLDVCYEELLADIKQLELFGRFGFNLAVIEISQAKVRSLQHQLRPRNPHHDDGRLIWRDHYSGLYPAVNYSEQFDLQWRLALEDPRGDFGQESSTRLDDCALNDMIESTFGERNYLKGCSEDLRESHMTKERGISRRNFVLLDVTRLQGADVLDVGCGFGRWTAMMLRLGANVTSIDASEHAVQSTRRHNPGRTFQMSLFDLPKLPSYEAGFDFVVCWGVLQHTHDPLAGFKLVASAVREGGVLFLQVYNDHSKAAYPYVQRLRRAFRNYGTVEERIEFLRMTHRAAGADVFDHLDGMLTFYNWAVHEETLRQWFLDHGFADYWKVWNYKYIGRKRPLERPVRDDSGRLLRNDLGERSSGVRYYPVQ